MSARSVPRSSGGIPVAAVAVPRSPSRGRRPARRMPPLGPPPVESVEFCNLRGEPIPATGDRLTVARMAPSFLAQVSSWLHGPG